MIYHEKRVRLPKPKYIVFYNGTKNQPDSMELKLSDCFENTDNEAPCLECTATMLNINYGHNQELMKHCRRLEEYSIFVQCVREYIQSEPSVEDALEKAIDTCINQDVLADFLKKHRAEVTNMILTTYDKDLYEKTLKEDAREEGRAEIRAELNNPSPNPVTDHRLRCSASPPYISHGIFLFGKFLSLTAITRSLLFYALPTIYTFCTSITLFPTFTSILISQYI
jgi:hypothetical protein